MVTLEIVYAGVSSSRVNPKLAMRAGMTIQVKNKTFQEAKNGDKRTITSSPATIPKSTIKVVSLLNLSSI